MAMMHGGPWVFSFLLMMVLRLEGVLQKYFNLLISILFFS
jgi:hypothetical protein